MGDMHAIDVEEPRETAAASARSERPVSGGPKPANAPSAAVSFLGRTFLRADQPSELPYYTVVLTAPDGEIPMLDASREIVAAVEVAPRSAAIILHGESARNSDDYLTLRARLRQADYSVSATYIASSMTFATIGQRGSQDGLAETEATLDAESVKLFDRIIHEGVKAGASDIHVCVREHSAKVLIRVHSILYQAMSLSREAATEAVGVAYNKLAIETSRSKAEPQFNQRHMQYCVIDRIVDLQRWRFRYMSIIAEGGFDVVLRLLRAEAVQTSKTMSELGYEESQQEKLRLAMMKSVGAIFVAGVTGSGKTTTQMTLMTLDPERRKRKAYSVEDPVEYRIYGITQIPVQRDTSVEEDSAPFTEAVRALMRGDPDVIMIGEIRDKDTADLFAPAVMSGHRCMTTVHAASGIEIVGRLTAAPIMMSRYVLASKRFISCLIYQALIPLICPHCSRPASEVLEPAYLNFVRKKFAVPTDQMRVAGTGCDKCHNPVIGSTGIQGQTVAAEIIIPDSTMLVMIREGRDTEAEEYWRKTRKTGFADGDMTGKTAFEHGLYKAVNGLVDPRHLEGVFESFMTYEIVETDIDKAAA